MATYTVTTTGDVVDPADGQLSLREALALADADPATADTIDFAPNVQGETIVLGGTQLTVGSDVTIDGGSGVTIDGNRLSRVLLVRGEGSDATLKHLAISGGAGGYSDTGGGIRAEEGTTLSLDQTTVSASGARSGGGIDGDTVTLNDSAITLPCSKKPLSLKKNFSV